MRTTPRTDLDSSLLGLSKKKADWLVVPLPERVALLRACMKGIAEVAERWVLDGCAVKGLDPNGPSSGEEWLGGPVVTMRNLRQLVTALEQGGAPPPKRLRKHTSGAIIADVLASGAFEGALFAGHRAEVWIEPGRPPTQGRIYRNKNKKGTGAVCVVLGAGNVSSIPFMDALYKLFAEDEVVLVKVNPVNEYVGPLIERAFAPLISAGFLAVAYGGAEEGAYLCEHELCDTLHVTGSDRTYDAVVWGADPEERARRKKQGERKNARPFTAELGCVTPVLVVPGPWSKADLSFQAKHVAAMVANNGSFNCNAAKVVVVAKGWVQRGAFLSELEQALAKTPPRRAYYPGAKDRFRAFLEHYPQADPVGPTGDDVVPWTVLPDVPPKRGEYALSNEAFCGVLATTSLEANDPAEFLTRAVRFANDDCWGTLSCMMLVHPSTLESFEAEVDRAITDLRYGCIGVNAWAAMGYALGSTTWGAYPGHTPQDIQSGTGVVHNSMLFDHPQKSVVHAPFRSMAKPAYFADHRTANALGRALLAHEAAPSFGTLARVMLAGARG
jgi:acyl-CoA reductase-like NAD-dependent aldehyde dehydrogenase